MTGRRDLVPITAVALVCVASLGASGLGLSGSGSAGLGLWAASIVLFGVPHGACDHLLAAKLFSEEKQGNRSSFYLGFSIVYLGLAGAVVALWLLAPTAALTFFLVLTAWHWGSSDEIKVRDDGLWPFVLLSVARGAVVVCAPVVFHPGESRAAFGMITDIFGEPGVDVPQWLNTAALVGLFLGIALLISNAANSLLSYKDRRWKAARDLAETTLLLSMFYLVSPILAVGIYFVFWHAWRHVLRVGTVLGVGGSGEISLVLRYHRLALPLTLVSVVLLAAVIAASRTSFADGFGGVFGTLLVLISALTAPHALLITLWDLRGGYVGHAVQNSSKDRSRVPDQSIN